MSQNLVFFLNHGRVFLIKKNHGAYRNSCVVSTVKFGGGGVTVWCAMSYRNTRFFTSLNGSLNKDGYETPSVTL